VIKHYFQRREITVRIGRRIIRGVRESYGQERPGRLLTLFGSSGTLEIACNLGSAAELMGYIPGKVMEVKIRKVEHRTSNIECLMGKNEEKEIGAPCSAMEVCFSFEVGRSMFDVQRSF
jgi:hypothetical protein